jgi:DNA invertase Pin-like site-specific DNA recombinase
MKTTSKITSDHLERFAVIYVRQSTLAQVRDHTESTARQYALTEEAARLGWPTLQIQVIDCDLGVSGRAGSGRLGFKDLVGRVCLGEVGAIFGLEVSRLARSNADLSRLLELCSLTDTLIVDTDGVYDLGSFNDRLLLGLKGTMSEAELHIIAGRLQGAKNAAAARGELRFPLPVGYVYEDSKIVMDPDEEIRRALMDVFSEFSTTGSAYGVVGAFSQRRFPRRAYGGVWGGEIRWGRLTHGRVLGILSNPVYAGAYVFGRYRSKRTVNADGTIRTKTVELPREQWRVLLQNNHQEYISWDSYIANGKHLLANCARRSSRPAREGTALLQGIVFCGSCGRAMQTSYPAGKATYDCGRSRHDHVNTADCRSVIAGIVDTAVAERFLQAVVPEEIALALAAADEVITRRTNESRAHELRMERMRYESSRAERAFHLCDPDNRLVARSLEKRWEDKLQELAATEQEFASLVESRPEFPERSALEVVARDLPNLWQSSSTSAKDRKRILRTIIADVTLRSRKSSDEIYVGIRWRSGAADELMVQRPGVARRTPRQAIDVIKHLGPQLHDSELTAELNRLGLLTGTGHAFDEAAVRWVRYAHKVPSPSLFGANEMSVQHVATRLGVSSGVVYGWINDGQLEARRGSGKRFFIPFDAAIESLCRQRISASTRLVPRTQNTTVGAAV